MENAFARDGLSGFLVAITAAVDLAINILLTRGDGCAQFLAQVEPAAVAKGARADELQHGFRRLKICPIFETVSSRTCLAIEIHEVHGEVF